MNAWLPTITIRTGGATLALVAGVAWLALCAGQRDFPAIAGGFLLAGLGYLAVLAGPARYELRWWLGLAIVLRVGLVFCFPLLSDDLYRFIWDGRLLAAGFNPFDELPGYYLQPAFAEYGLDQALYARLNSPDYYTIYPPVAQAVFWLAAKLAPGSWYGVMLVIKFFLLACELLSLRLLLFLLDYWRLPRERILWYALNPLILIEIMGNLHFEGAMIAFLLLAVAAFTLGWVRPAAIALALSVAAKLLPLMFTPYLLRRYRWPRLWRFSFWFGVVLLLLFVPLFSSAFAQNLGSSLDLYFRQFEFNASLYYLARWYGFQWVGWNLIDFYGPLLAGLAAFLIFFTALTEADPTWRTLPLRMMWAMVFFLCCTTTVHPWYLSMPLALSVFTRYRFVAVWSLLIPLTYIHYWEAAFAENYWVIALEYLLVGAYLGWELAYGQPEPQTA